MGSASSVIASREQKPSVLRNWLTLADEADGVLQHFSLYLRICYLVFFSSFPFLQQGHGHHSHPRKLTLTWPKAIFSVR